MKIEKFRIQGFKSITDITVDGLSDINVFFGLNDVGKSNIFQALAMLCSLLRSIQWHDDMSVKAEYFLEHLEQPFGQSLFQVGGNNVIEIEIDLLLEPAIENSPRMLNLSARLQLRYNNKVDVELDIQPKQDNNLSLIAELIPRLNIINANRRLIQEKFEPQNRPIQITDANLKQALFYAYLSPQTVQKQRLESIRQLLAEPPFELGMIDVALHEKDHQINIGFIRPNGRLPIENLGSGPQQLLLVLGQIFLNEDALIVIEEPEMNFSPRYQEQLLSALKKLIDDSATGLKQLFISTHSPYLEFTENFYEVTMNADGETEVKRSTPEKHATHFAQISACEDTGARLNSQNQVKLYDGLIKDMNLKRGDLLFFVKNEQERWEIQHEDEVAEKMAAAFDGLQEK